MIGELILDLYDEEVSHYPDGIKVADAKDLIRDAVRDLIAQEPRDLDREVNAAINQAVDPARDQRSRAMVRDLEFILDYFASPDEAALIPDSRMQWAIRLGTTDGADKSLRYWTAGDFLRWAQVRQRQAQEVLASAEEAITVADRVAARMLQSNAQHFGDVDWTRP